MVRKVLYDLFGKSLITGIKVKDERKGVVRIQVEDQARGGWSSSSKSRKKR